MDLKPSRPDRGSYVNFGLIGDILNADPSISIACNNQGERCIPGTPLLYTKSEN
jgi:hypothetical protein